MEGKGEGGGLCSRAVVCRGTPVGGRRRRRCMASRPPLPNSWGEARVYAKEAEEEAGDGAVGVCVGNGAVVVVVVVWVG